MTGVFTFIDGDQQAQRYLLEGESNIERMLVDLVNDIAEHAHDELEVLAPGQIGTSLIGLNRAHSPEPGVIRAVAGVERDLSDEDALTGEGGLGSDPADYPVYVEVGSGVFGPIGQPIRSIPGHPMVIQFPEGKIFTETVLGQHPQHYAQRAYENTVRWIPERLTTSRLPSGGT